MKKVSVLLLATFVIMGGAISHATITTMTNESSWQATVGTWNLADFEGFLGSVGTRYPGVTFSDFNGGSPFTIEQFPYQGTKSLFTVFAQNGGGGGWATDFNGLVNGVAFWAHDVEFPGTTVSFYDVTHSLLGTFDLLAAGGGNGPFAYGFNGFISDAFDIARVEVAINSTENGGRGDAIWFDNFQFSPPAQTPVPEPASIWLLGSALAAVALGGRLRRK